MSGGTEGEGEERGGGGGRERIESMYLQCASKKSKKYRYRKRYFRSGTVQGTNECREGDGLVPRE